ncbi:MAG: molybdopterin-dependent oxidoreductase [Pseudomonadota bacterium]
MAEPTLTSNHWGLGLVHREGPRITRVAAHPLDPAPSGLNRNMADGLASPSRVLRPAIRQGWLEGSGRRGEGPFVEVGWDAALDHVARALTRTREADGNEAIFAGSYGWASAGRFHHAQSQLKRFLNCIGGCVTSEGNYSYNAALVALPHIVGGSFREHIAQATRWSVIAENSGLVVAFGGLAERNMQICDGGNSRHLVPQDMARAREAGVQFVNISPLRGDLEGEWLPVEPGTDCALMLALSQTLIEEGLHDAAFLAEYCTGFEVVADYLTGRADGVRKDADWAAGLCGLAPDTIRSLARRMAATRTFITCAASLQRADWGEQPLWASVTLASILGQIGLPGGGYGIGYAVNGHVGAVERPFRAGALPQGENPISRVIPVAMIADMLLRPGSAYRYDGDDHVLPCARLVWWAGGNPFHHHQDLRRLREAFQTPETIIVNEVSWTATARHADIVLPVAASPERRDFGAGKTDNVLVPMPRAVPPPGAARTEFDLFSDLAARMGITDAFTEGLDEEGWLKRLWQETRRHAPDLPDWEAFMAGGPIVLDDPCPGRVFLSDFRKDPQTRPRPTPSGKIELYSEVVAGFGLPDCPGHAAWSAPREAGGLALLSGQPATRLHSQFDDGALSLGAKIAGREPVLIHPADAAARGVRAGDVVELESARGRCLAGARLTEGIARGCVFLWTGAWYQPDAGGHCVHGNPNVLTHDLRTSAWSQSPAAHSTRVELRPLAGDPPDIHVHSPPRFVQRG